ncbi:MAG: Re/Si-specific NAD(P)(+) transhydrogenase subunit beta, partial [Gammaproteobacteria bacterium]|nr:Re/Si-specific NAD(P)(+) transhydrogenase subunit beta [Gammaproteobacteria bacterium]
MNYGIILSAYILSSILFILSLGGLSHQETARRGNVYGIIGMAIAIIATLLSDQVGNYGLIIACMLVGGTIGAWVASRGEMTAMPELVARLHSC